MCVCVCVFNPIRVWISQAGASSKTADALSKQTPLHRLCDCASATTCVNLYICISLSFQRILLPWLVTQAVYIYTYIYICIYVCACVCVCNPVRVWISIYILYRFNTNLFPASLHRLAPLQKRPTPCPSRPPSTASATVPPPPSPTLNTTATAEGGVAAQAAATVAAARATALRLRGQP